MQVRIDDIKVRKRVRRNPGDLTALMDSMRKYGLLQPIVVDPDYTLIAGYRRLLAAKQLGWRTIPVVVLNRQDEAELLEIELEENLQRKDFSLEELTQGSIRLEKLRNPGFFYRLWLALLRWLRSIFKKKRKRPIAPGS